MNYKEGYWILGPSLTQTMNDIDRKHGIDNDERPLSHREEMYAISQLKPVKVDMVEFPAKALRWYDNHQVRLGVIK